MAEVEQRVVRCPAGHYYDANRYAQCPHCVQDEPALAGASVTTPIADDTLQDDLKIIETYRRMQAAEGKARNNGAAGAGVDHQGSGEGPVTTVLTGDGPVTTVLPSDNSVTTVLPSDDSVTTVLPSDGSVTTVLPSDSSVTTVLPSDSSVTTVLPSDSSATTHVSQGSDSADGRPAGASAGSFGGFPAPKPRVRPSRGAAETVVVGGGRVADDGMCAVGWLVATSGPCRGRDFHLRPGYNFIGRDRGKICLRGDMGVSTERDSSVIYDSETRTFYIEHVLGKNVLRLNGKPVLGGGVELSAYDVIKIGNTELMFVPLCGPHFSWETGPTQS